MVLDDTYRTGRATTRPMSLVTAALILLSLVLVALPAPTLAAQPFVVNRLADGIDRNVGDGVCDASPAAGVQCSLRAAVMEANAQPGANVITLPAGTYLLVIPGENEDGTAADDLDVTDTLTINGAGAGTTIVDADELDRVFHVHDSAGGLSLTKLTLQNGSSLTGGGIHAVGTSVRLTSSTVRMNKGIGIAVHGSTLDLLYTTLRDNSGSGIAAYEGSSIRLLRSTLTANFADYGAGLHVAASTATLVNSVVTGNSTGYDGGGIYLASGALGLYNTTVAANNAGRASDYDDLDAGYGVASTSLPALRRPLRTVYWPTMGTISFSRNKATRSCSRSVRDRSSRRAIT